MSISHLLGMARVPLLLLAAFFLIHESAVSTIGAMLAILGAMVTDALDGFIARRQGTVSDFGAVLDLTMDKAFVCPCLFLLAGSDPLLLWFSVVITLREFVVMGMRIHGSTHGDVLHARLLGKAKLWLIYAGMLLVLLEVRGGTLALGVAATLAVVSSIDYAVRLWPALRVGLFPSSAR